MGISQAAWRFSDYVPALSRTVFHSLAIVILMYVASGFIYIYLASNVSVVLQRAFLVVCGAAV